MPEMPATHYLRLAAIGVPAGRGVPMADPFATVEPFTGVKV
jgi:hypothetical protein